MTDPLAGDEAGGRSNKKNQKRRTKAKKAAHAELDGVQHQPKWDPVEELRQRLADAKLSKDHKLASKLRQQLWIVQDLAGGVEPRVDPDDAEGQALVAEFQRTGIISLQPADAAGPRPTEPKKEPAPVLTPVAGGVGGAVVEDKRTKNLNKKLKQIEQLKVRQAKGEKLEANQLEKIKSEAAVRQEIREIEELIRKISAEIKR